LTINVQYCASIHSHFRLVFEKIKVDRCIGKSCVLHKLAIHPDTKGAVDINVPGSSCRFNGFSGFLYKKLSYLFSKQEKEFNKEIFFADRVTFTFF
jgi:hypothetical protein